MPLKVEDSEYTDFVASNSVEDAVREPAQLHAGFRGERFHTARDWQVYVAARRPLQRQTVCRDLCVDFRTILPLAEYRLSLCL